MKPSHYITHYAVAFGIVLLATGILATLGVFESQPGGSITSLVALDAETPEPGIAKSPTTANYTDNLDNNNNSDNNAQESITGSW